MHARHAGAGGAPPIYNKADAERPGRSCSRCTRPRSRDQTPLALALGLWACRWTPRAFAKGQGPRPKVCRSETALDRRTGKGQVSSLGGVPHEQRASAGRHEEGRVHPDVGRQAAEVGRQRAALRGLGDLPPQGLAGRSRTGSTRRSRAAGSARSIQRSNDGGKTWEPVGNKFVYDGDARHAPVVRRHAAPVGVQARLAPRAVADRSRHGLRRRRGRRAVPHRPTAARRWHELPGLRSHGSGQHVAAGRRRHVPAHDPARPDATRSGCSSPSRPPARSAPTTAARPGSRSTAGLQVAVRSPTPTPRSATACTASPCTRRGPNVLFMQKHWDVMRTDDAGDNVARSQRQPADRLRLPDRRPRARARDDLRRADQERLGALSRPTASCASTAAAPAATSGSR